ncbi:hypothetical protein J6590_002766 [Homalodisca vitripennis]|nr:hypothetical protein J6590_002766 [Homalodisca vitripennis]
MRGEEENKIVLSVPGRVPKSHKDRQCYWSRIENAEFVPSLKETWLWDGVQCTHGQNISRRNISYPRRVCGGGRLLGSLKSVIRNGRTSLKMGVGVLIQHLDLAHALNKFPQACLLSPKEGVGAKAASPSWIQMHRHHGCWIVTKQRCIVERTSQLNATAIRRRNRELTPVVCHMAARLRLLPLVKLMFDTVTYQVHIGLACFICKPVDGVLATTRRRRAARLDGSVEHRRDCSHRDVFVCGNNVLAIWPRNATSPLKNRFIFGFVLHEV